METIPRLYNASQPSDIDRDRLGRFENKWTHVSQSHQPQLCLAFGIHAPPGAAWTGASPASVLCAGIICFLSNELSSVRCSPTQSAAYTRHVAMAPEESIVGEISPER